MFRYRTQPSEPSFEELCFINNAFDAPLAPVMRFLSLVPASYDNPSHRVVQISNDNIDHAMYEEPSTDTELNHQVIRFEELCLDHYVFSPVLRFLSVPASYDIPAHPIHRFFNNDIDPDVHEEPCMDMECYVLVARFD